MNRFFVLTLLACALNGIAQFAPPVGQPGTTAVYKDSSVFVAWATGCRIQRGLQDVSDPSLGNANVGDSTMATGIPDPGIVSLGDLGEAILTFANPIADGPGFDFAVFENSFSDDFLELAFVEVSSDGINFFRFPAVSNVQDTIQTWSFGPTDATLINNLAGKYRGGYGTPFDLNELSGTAGLNSNAITHVKIIDVVGSINPQYATYDSQGHKVNDPWPTGFGSSGFDLDAVGVMHSAPVGLEENNESHSFSLYPNPAGEYVHINCMEQCEAIVIRNIIGQAVAAVNKPSAKFVIETGTFPKGLYLVEVLLKGKILTQKLVIQ